jgi:hypothetical protein
LIIGNSELLAPGRPIRALASDGSAAARFKSGDVSAIDRVARHVDIANNFYDVAKSFSHAASQCACNIQRRMLRSMLRVCAWHVASSRACNVQHRESFSPPSMLRLYCDHVATRIACNIQHQELSSPSPIDTNPNITCLQHRNSTSATLKFNVCNTQHQGPSSSTQHHISAISKLNVCNIQN